jgi:hypothetical protein
MRELRERLYAHLRDAREHGDLHAMTNLRIGQPNMVWLMEDDTELARGEIDRAMRDWRLPGFHIEHHYAMLARVNVALYAGDTEAARADVLRAWPGLERSYLMRIPAVRVQARAARARTAIALARSSDRARSAPLLDEAARLARSLTREPLPFAKALGELVHAGVLAARGKTRAASLRFAAAERACDSLELLLHSVAARRRRGEIERDDALVRDADVWMASESIDVPARFAAMLAP